MPDAAARGTATRMDACRSPRAWALMLIALVAGVALDIGSKSWSFANVADRPVVLDRETLVSSPGYDPVPSRAEWTAVPRLVQFRLVINRGAVFGIGANQRSFFILFTLVALAAGIYVFARMMTAQARFGHAAVGMVLAGGLGNLHDRIRFGAVRDFLHLMPDRELPFGWTWPGGNPELFPWVFNVADVLLLVGMVGLMLNLNRRGRRPARVTAPAAEPMAAGGE